VIARLLDGGPSVLATGGGSVMDASTRELIREKGISVWLNADVAARMGLTDGYYVRLKNQDGVVSNRVRLKATQRIRPDCVYMVHGFGHTAVRLRRTVGKGASDAQLVTRFKTDPLMGGTGMNVNFVAVEAEA
jgi:thiosulfate reductase/polysulfide reductase chain A